MRKQSIVNLSVLFQSFMTCLFVCVNSIPSLALVKADNEHEKVDLHFALKVSSNSADPAIQDLIRLAINNEIPLGIILGNDQSICRDRLPIREDAIEVGSIIYLINENVHGYHADLKDGVLNIMPLTMPEQTTSLIISKYLIFKAIQRH